jgi:hypothetical protein
VACFSDTTTFRSVHPISLGFQPKTPAYLRGSPSIIVREKARKIDAPHGLSHGERDLTTEGLEHIRRLGPGVFVSIESGHSPESEQIVRNVTERVRSHIATLQKRGGLRKRHAVTVFEALGRDGQPKFNGHIVAAAKDAEHRDKIIEALAWSKYGEHIVAESVDDWEGMKGYLLKEGTPQAQFRRDFRRIGGSIPLGVGGGNRAILSKDLKNTLIRSGRIETYTRTYASLVSLPVAPPQIAAAPPPMDVEAWFASLPLLAAPPRRKRVPVKREKHPPPSLPMDYAPTLVEIMQQLGRTKQEIGDKLDLSRQQTNNVAVWRYGLSRPMARRVLELARAA